VGDGEQKWPREQVREQMREQMIFSEKLNDFVN
jgi:hypothetical protein